MSALHKLIDALINKFMRDFNALNLTKLEREKNWKNEKIEICISPTFPNWKFPKSHKELKKRAKTCYLLNSRENIFFELLFFDSEKVSGESSFDRTDLIWQKNFF